MMRNKTYYQVILALTVVFGPAILVSAQTVQGEKARNPGFETAPQTADEIVADWEVYSTHSPAISRQATSSYSGNYGLMLCTQNKKSAYTCLIQNHEVTPGVTYQFTARIINNRNDPLQGTAHGKLTVEWLNENGGEISRDAGEQWDANLSRMVWLRHRFDFQAPPKAVEARFVVLFSDGDMPAQGSCFLDDISIREME